MTAKLLELFKNADNDKRKRLLEMTGLNSLRKKWLDTLSADQVFDLLQDSNYREKLNMLGLCSRETREAVTDCLKEAGEPGFSPNELTSITFFGMQPIKKTADNQICAEDQD